MGGAWLGSIEPPFHQQDLNQRLAYMHHQFLQAEWLYNFSTSYEVGKGQVRGFHKSRLEVRSNCFVTAYYLLGFSADLWMLLSIEPVWCRESDSQEIKVHLM